MLARYFKSTFKLSCFVLYKKSNRLLSAQPARAVEYVDSTSALG